MSEVYEYDCREAAADTLDRIAEIVNISVWTLDSDAFEKRIERAQRELKTLNIILAAWKLAEAKSKGIAAQYPIMEETSSQNQNA